MNQKRRWPAIAVLLIGIVGIGLLYLVPGTADFGKDDSGQRITATCRALGPGVGSGPSSVFTEDTVSTSEAFKRYKDENQGTSGQSGYEYFLNVQIGVNHACDQVRGNQQAALTLAIGALVVFVVLARRRICGDRSAAGRMPVDIDSEARKGGGNE